MDVIKSGRGSSIQSEEEEEEDLMDLRRGPWTVEEDFALINYIAHHGEGRWNTLAKSAGLKRTGKSCRLRWLNYLRPDVRRGNITLEEQLLILELHSRWGNRWSKIAQYLPGRTDNEIKNYWRTRVQKHAKQLKCDVNSKQFKDAMRYIWVPRLVERIQAAAASGGSSNSPVYDNQLINNQNLNMEEVMTNLGVAQMNSSYGHESCITAASSDSIGIQVSPVSDSTTSDCYNYPLEQTAGHQDYYNYNQQAAAGNGCSDDQIVFGDCSISPSWSFNQELDVHQFQGMDQNNHLMDGGGISNNWWNVEDYWYMQQQLSNHSHL